MQILKNENKEILAEIPLCQIRMNPYQPRKYFSEESIKELASSIHRYGLLQPISVRRCKTEGIYELVAGERRLRACKLNGMKCVKAVIIDGMSDKDSAVLAMIENLQRENLGFFEEAEGMKSLMNSHSMTQEELARLLSKNQSTIANKLRILKLPRTVREKIIRHGLTERHARTLLRLHDENAQLSAIDRIVREGMSVKATENLVEKLLIKLYDSDDIINEEKTDKSKPVMKNLDSIRECFYAVNKKISDYTEKDEGEYIVFSFKVYKNAV